MGRAAHGFFVYGRCVHKSKVESETCLVLSRLKTKSGIEAPEEHKYQEIPDACQSGLKHLAMVKAFDSGTV